MPIKNIPPKKSLRLLHTSDWHIGKRLVDMHRYDEFEQFLQWICKLLKKTKTDVLIVAGDIFDTSAPSNKAQKLYYQFLSEALNICHVIITAGNHDSPTFLEAPKQILNHLGIHIVGTPSALNDEAYNGNIDELICLEDNHKNPLAIICAAPYLRDKDIKTSSQMQFGQSIQDIENHSLQALQSYYKKIAYHAKKKQQIIIKQHQKQVPIIATGHFFAQGGAVSSSDDGMRNLSYVGGLQLVDTSFAQHFDYVALGHIHRAQKVGQVHVRYSGAPLAFGFLEAKKQKYVLLVDFDENNISAITKIDVPIFRHLFQISGDYNKIAQEIYKIKNDLKNSNTLLPAFAEVIYYGKLETNLMQKFGDLNDEYFRILSIKNSIMSTPTIKNNQPLQALDDKQIFKQILDRYPDDKINDAYRKKLLEHYEYALHYMHEQKIEQDN